MHTTKPVKVEGKVAEFKPVLMDGCQCPWAFMELVVDCVVLLDLSLCQTLSIEVLAILVW